MHYKKNPGLVENHASRKIMHRGTQVNNYARREDFMPRQIYILREDFIPRWNLRIAGRYSCPAREHTWIKKGKSCIPRAIFIHRPQLHPLFLKKKKKEKKRKINIKKSIEDDDKRNINIASASIYLFWHQTKSTLKIISQNKA